MRLRSRVFLMTTLWAVMLLSITAVLSWRARTSEQAFSHLVEVEVETIALLNDFISSQNAYRNHWSRSGTEDDVPAKLVPLYKRVIQALDRSHGVRVDPSLERIAEEYEGELHRVSGAWDRASPTERGLMAARLIADSDRVQAVATQLVERKRNEIAQTLDELSRQARDTMWSSLAIAWMIAIFAFALARRALQNIVQPVERLSAAAEAIAEGNLETRAPIGGDEEIRRLGRSFNRMTTALIASHEELEERARTDDLTGLPNFRALGEALIQEIERSSRYEQSFGVLVMDLDHFKKYNDTYGHLAGNDALQMTAAVIRGVIRSVDFPARYGGEEFVVLVPRCDHQGLAHTAERVRSAIQSLPPISDRRRLTVSVGGALYPFDGTTADELFAAADRRLYQAKEGGRNRVVLPEPASNVLPHIPRHRRKTQS